MTDTTTTVEVPADLFTGGTSDAARSWNGACRECGVPLQDRRKTLCENCKASMSTDRPKARKPRTASSKALESKLNGTTANLLATLTLFWAWSLLRKRGILDPHGEIATHMAFTNEEAVNIGRPLTRLFLKLEPGRKAAPHIVENEDMVDAIFSLIDWYKRNTTLLENYQQDRLPPLLTRPGKRNKNGKPPRTNERNADTGESDRQFDSDYIPPGPNDFPL